MKKSSAIKYDNVFQHLGHDCEMLVSEDEIEVKYPAKTILNRIKRFFVKAITVDEKICKAGATHLRSHGAIEREKQRQIRYYSKTIHPYSKAKIWWEIFILFIYHAQFILIPLDVAFYNYPITAPFFMSHFFISVRMVLDLISCFNCVVSARTGYYDESKKEIILDRKRILRKYMKFQFWSDLSISIPTHFDLFFNMRKNDNTAQISLIILQAISFLKLRRYYFVKEECVKICKIFKVNYYVFHITFMISAILIYWHCVSFCKVFFYTMFDDTRNIIRYVNISMTEAVCTSYYDGAVLFFHVAYGMEEPIFNYEFLLTSIIWILSKGIQIIILVRAMEFMRAFSSSHLLYVQMVKQLNEFMRHRQLPMHTQKRILTYYDFHFRKSYFSEREIHATISGQLRQEILMQTCRQLVENVEFFKDIPVNLLVRIVTCLKSEIYLTNDVIVKASTMGNSMYFIATGTVAVYTPSGKELCHLQDGAHFGEVALVTPDATRIASVIAAEICELYKLDRKDFVKAIHPYPDLLEKIQKVAADRMEKANAMEEHFKRDMGFKKNML